MKIGYLCKNGHLTVGDKPEGVSGKMFEKIHCIHCGEVSSIFDEFSLSESVPVHFEFFKAGIVSDKDQIEFVEKGYLLIRPVEDLILTKEFQATKAIQQLAEFMLENTEESERLPDIIDTAIVFMSRYFTSRNAVKNLPEDFDKHLN